MLPIIRRYKLYMYSNWYVLYVRLNGGWPGELPVNLTYNTYQLLYIYSVYLLVMGNICPKHVEVK
jgi:hypothetical protein